MNSQSEEPKKRIPPASIPATIIIGLLIAALYLGGRILTARRVRMPAPAAHVVPPPAQHAQPAQAVAKPPATPPVEAVVPKSASPVPPASSSGDNGLPMIQPQSGERYIQVGALDPDAKDTRRFVERLRGEGLDPHVAEGPTPELMRVLIGPFAKLDALNEKKAQIESEGIDTFVREY